MKDLVSAFVQGLLLKKDPVAAPESKHGFIRRNIEGYTTAIAFALLIKQGAIDTFQVPTESMEPVILGRGSLGDRILVDRLAYLCEDPARYDIVVFKYPLSRLVNYVKRAVGLPNERIKIWNGQIFAAKDLGYDFQCTRKPDAVQEAVFSVNEVLPAGDTEKFDGPKFFRQWQANGHVPRFDDGSVRVEAPAGEERLIENKFDVTNRRMDRFAAEAQGKQGGDERSGDVRLDVDVQPEPGAGSVLFEIKDPSNSGRPLRLELAVEGGPASSLLRFGDENWTDAVLAAVKLKPGAKTRVVFDNVDQAAQLKVGGRKILRREYSVAPNGPINRTNAVSIRAGVRGGVAKFARIDIRRDTHYSEFHGAPTEFELKGDVYLMLGENSPNSLDARGFKRSAIRIHGEEGVIYGDAEAVSERIESVRRGRNPYRLDDGYESVARGHFGQTGDGTAEFFLDVYGNEIRLEPGKWDMCDAATGEVRHPNVMSVNDVPNAAELRAFDHLVPRDYVSGRASFTFFHGAYTLLGNWIFSLAAVLCAGYAISAGLGRFSARRRSSRGALGFLARPDVTGLIAFIGFCAAAAVFFPRIGVLR